MNKQRTYRSTISIPLHLKKRMEKADALQSINWSAIAARAFEEKLDALNLSSPELITIADLKEKLSEVESTLLRKLYYDIH